MRPGTACSLEGSHAYGNTLNLHPLRAPSGLGHALFVAACVALLGLTGPAVASAADEPVRFLLTFDDGPRPGEDSPTRLVLQQLKDNPTTPGIKAVFFVQTAHVARGGSDAGRQLMREACADGHLLGLHSGTARGHIPHTKLAAAELDVSLIDGTEAILAQCAGDPTLVRPPDWEFNDATLAAYQRIGMEMLLSDVSANDGKIYGWTVSLRRRAHLHSQLEYVARARARNLLQVSDGVMPVVVTFHDVNPYTASHMSEYLTILVDEARAIGLPLATPAFYTSTVELDRAAHLRAHTVAYVCDGVSRSTPFLRRLFGSDAERYRSCMPRSD
jgi:peptidoglycan/xylan/chitin deacetylase (PgdA/CDA1 family)